MNKYKIPVSWTMDLIVDIEADCLGDAIEEVISSTLSKKEAVFRPGSFTVHQEDAQVEVPEVPAHYVEAVVGGDE